MLSELDKPMRGISLQPNGLDLSYDEYIMVLKKLMEFKELRASPS